MNTFRNAALTVSGISKSFDGEFIIDGISFVVEPHSVTALLGQSGCGKTTLLNIISGLTIPDTGSIAINGTILNGNSEHISYMQQDDLLMPWKRVIDNIALPLVIKGSTPETARKKVREYLPLFGLERYANAYPYELSGGMRQRAALLRTYICSGKVLLLDEPFGALDAKTRAVMHEWFRSIINELHPAVLLVTHDVHEALSLADTVIVIKGRPARISGIITVPSVSLQTVEENSQIKQRIWDAL